MNEPNQANVAPQWAGARGDKWRANLSGMEAMLQPVEGPLIRSLILDRPYRIADVGCGGGGTTLEIHRHAPSGSLVHGFDISEALVRAAQARGPSHGLSFSLADVSQEPPPEEPYDRLTSRFGIMFFEDPAAAFENLAGWLKPGGRCAFAVWGPPASNPWMTTVRDVVSEYVDLPATDPDAPHLFRYSDAAKLVGLLQHAGLSELDATSWRGALPMGGRLEPEEASRFVLTAFGSFHDALSRAGADTFDEARRALSLRFADHHRDGAVRLEAHVHLVTGRRP